MGAVFRSNGGACTCTYLDMLSSRRRQTSATKVDLPHNY